MYNFYRNFINRKYTSRVHPEIATKTLEVLADFSLYGNSTALDSILYSNTKSQVVECYDRVHTNYCLNGPTDPHVIDGVYKLVAFISGADRGHTSEFMPGWGLDDRGLQSIAKLVDEAVNYKRDMIKNNQRTPIPDNLHHLAK